MKRRLIVFVLANLAALLTAAPALAAHGNGG